MQPHIALQLFRALINATGRDVVGFIADSTFGRNIQAANSTLGFRSDLSTTTYSNVYNFYASGNATNDVTVRVVISQKP